MNLIIVREISPYINQDLSEETKAVLYNLTRRVNVYSELKKELAKRRLCNEFFGEQLQALLKGKSTTDKKCYCMALIKLFKIDRNKSEYGRSGNCQYTVELNYSDSLLTTFDLNIVTGKQ